MNDNHMSKWDKASQEKKDAISRIQQRGAQKWWNNITPEELEEIKRLRSEASTKSTNKRVETLRRNKIEQIKRSPVWFTMTEEERELVEDVKIDGATRMTIVSNAIKRSTQLVK